MTNIVEQTGPEINADFGEIANECGEGERLSAIMPGQFQRYFDQWVKFWPRKSFIVKRGYDQKWYHQLRKKDRKYLPLFEELAVEHTEHHLDNTQWAEWKHTQGWTKATDAPFWFGLGMPKCTDKNLIDIDTKEYQIELYRPWQYHKVKQTAPPRPVMNLPLEHFRRIKSIYDTFPNRIWAVSSATLGLHAACLLTRPLPSQRVHDGIKQNLRLINLGNIEVHPMPGRQFRRPFGRDYLTITPSDTLTTWWEQLDYWDYDGRTPDFRQIASVLLDLMKAQWRMAGYAGDCRAIEDWLEKGCPAAGAYHNGAPHVPDGGGVPPPSMETLAPSVAEEKPVLRIASGAGIMYRNMGHQLACLRDGLLDSRQATPILWGWAKLLRVTETWDDAVVVKNLDKIRNKAGKRLTEPGYKKLLSSMKSIKITEKDRKDFLAVAQAWKLRELDWTNLDQFWVKEDSNDLTFTFVLCVSAKELPFQITRMIQVQVIKQVRPGSCKLLAFAEKLLPYLYQHPEGKSLGQKELTQILGYWNRNRVNKYRDILVAAGLITVGWYYVSTRKPKEWKLTPEAKKHFDEAGLLTA